MLCCPPICTRSGRGGLSDHTGLGCTEVHTKVWDFSWSRQDAWSLLGGLPDKVLDEARWPRPEGVWIRCPRLPGEPGPPWHCPAEGKALRSPGRGGAGFLAVPASSQAGTPLKGQIWAGLSPKARGGPEQGQDVSPSLESSLAGAAKTTEVNLRGLRRDSSRMGMVPGIRSWVTVASEQVSVGQSPGPTASGTMGTWRPVPGWTPGSPEAAFRVWGSPSRVDGTLRLRAAQLGDDPGSPAQNRGCPWHMGTHSREQADLGTGGTQSRKRGQRHWLLVSVGTLHPLPV